MQIIHPNESQLKELDTLSSSIFLSHKPKEHMALRYSSLFSLENRDHIHVMTDDAGTPVSNVNWYPVRISLSDAVLTVGQIGGVCSHPSARGKGYADQLLKRCFQQMADEGIMLCLISGTRNLYLRNGAVPIGCELPFTFCETDFASDYRFYPSDRLADGAETVYRLHEAEPVRFCRTLSHTKDLLVAYSHSHHGFRGELYENGEAYVVVSVNEDPAVSPCITEFAGKPDAVRALFASACKRLGTPLSGVLMPYQAPDYPFLLTGEPCVPQHTGKIIRRDLLEEALPPHLSRFGRNALPDLPDDKLISLLFSGTPSGDAFPLPLPYLNSMDYQ